MPQPDPNLPTDLTSGVWRVEARHDEADASTFDLHDAKNLACALQATLDWARESLGTGAAPELDLAFGEMAAACRSLSSLLNRALDAHGSGRKGLGFCPREVNVAEAIGTSLARMRASGSRAGVEISSQISPIVALIDPDLVARALVNLLDNALRVAPRGSKVSVHAASWGDDVVISVSDEGPGIEPRDRVRIFDMYATGGSERSGHGIGLAFVRAVADAHGGYLSVDSTPGEGASFVLALPHSVRRDPR